MKVLVTGGAGYIGSHICVELLNAGHEVCVIDNLSNSSEIALERVEQITGKKLTFYNADIRNELKLKRVFEQESSVPIQAVIHLAGMKSVSESVQTPLEYYDNNINGTLVLSRVMREFGYRNMIFSLSATVYGKPDRMPITEECPKGHITNPYGQTKSMLEQILTDLHTADASWNIVILRYFNPVGAHISGLIGECPSGIPNNLMPYLSKVAQGKIACLSVYGNDFDTPDGTGVRDYIHVVDLAAGHINALTAIQRNCGVKFYNLGAGRGYSVLEVVNAFEKVSGQAIPYRIVERRPGDIDCCCADPTKAEAELGWKASRNVEDMCRDAWNWQCKNPNGYT